MDAKEFERQIKNIDTQTKREIVEKFASMKGEWKERQTEELIYTIYKTLGWPVGEMSFSQHNFGDKYTLVRSIYTILQMDRSFFGRIYLKCFNCGGEMVEEGRNYVCKKCNVISDCDPFLIEPKNVETVSVRGRQINFRKD